MPTGITQLKKTYVSRLISPKFGLINIEQLKYPLKVSIKTPREAVFVLPIISLNLIVKFR